MSLLRRAARGALNVLLWPVAEVLVWAWQASRSWPRRVPDLALLTRRAYFRRLQTAAAAWTDSNFELIEHGAPWLDRAGWWVWDRCETRLTSNPFSFPRDPPRVGCRREIAVAYGFDGDLHGRLAKAAAAVSAAGWGDPRGGPQAVIANIAERVPPVWPLRWAPVPGFGLPTALQAMPPDRRFPLESWLRMGIGWTSRCQPAELATSREQVPPGDPHTASATYQPVEVSDTDVRGLAIQALAQHEHAIAIRIDISYYKNPNANARPGRLRKKLLPVR